MRIRSLMQRLLLIYELIPEAVGVYAIPENHPQADNIKRADSFYIKGHNLPLEHPIWALSEWLGSQEAEHFKVDSPYKGTIAGIYRCGFFL